MKFWYFIKWCWNKLIAETKGWNHWMWAWIVTCGWGPTAFMNKETNPDNFYAFVLFLFLFWVLYGFVYTGIKRLYRKFQDEQQRMVDHLKDVG